MTTKQQTFDAVCEHLADLARLGVKSEVGGRCSYRADIKGWSLRCAVGYLIPDEDYTPRMETKTVVAKVVRGVLKKYGHDIALAMDLQEVHDTMNIRDWPAELRMVALQHGLSEEYVGKVEEALNDH